MNENQKKIIEAIESGLDFSEDPLGTEQVKINKQSISNYDFHKITTSQKDRWQLKNAHIEDSKIESCTFTGIRFQDSTFNNTHFKKVKFINCFFHKCNFIGVKLENVSFLENTRCVDTDLGRAHITKCELFFDGDNAIFSEALIANTSIEIESSRNVDFSNSKIIKNSIVRISHHEGPPFTTHCNFINSVINNCKLSDTKFKESNFENADLSNTEIINCQFSKSNLRNSKLYGIELSNEVTFDSTDFSGASIDRYSLECITLSQLPKSSRVKLNCKDDVAELRLMYSGIYGAINLLLLLLFFAPYLYFLGKLWVVAKFNIEGNYETISMIGALGRYIVSGGTYWQTEWDFRLFPIFIFLLAFIYNISRLILLAKTVSLEHKEKIHSLPVKFSLSEQPWSFLYKANKLFFYINFVVVFMHTVRFMTQQVPTSVG